MRQPNDTKKPNSNSRSMGQTLRQRERFVHVACTAGMVPNEKTGLIEPSISKGRTLDEGRNEAKRIARGDKNPIRRIVSSQPTVL